MDKDTILFVAYTILTGILIAPIITLYIPTFAFISVVNMLADRLEYNL